MDEANNQEERNQGYDEFFDPPLESKYECPICLLGLREPVQTSCGHRFCKGCIKRSIRDAGPKCPIDNEPLSENQEHLKNCPYVDVECPNKCGETIQRKDWDQHNAQQCPERTVICEYCQGEVVHTAYESHLTECLKAPAFCDLCKTSTAKDEMDDHKIRNCPMVVMTCPSKGCSFEGLQKDVKEHYVTQFADHMFDLAITARQQSPSTSNKAAAGLQEQQSNFGLQQTVAELTRNYHELRRRQEETRIRHDRHQQEMTHRQTRHEHETDAKVRRMVDTFQRSLNQTQVEAGIRYDQPFHEMTHRQIRHETRLLEYEGRVCNGTYIWKVENFRQCRQDAINGIQTAIHSPPFFTSMYGLKMCMKINLNGVDSGVGKHISLFVQMMQGEWDEVVKWPFTGLITLSVLDQSEDVDNRCHIMQTFFANRNLLALQRQTAQRNDQWHGYKEFAPINALLNGQYVKKNVLLVKFEISR